MLKYKIIVVTGGAGLIGKTFIREIAKQGGVAIIADYNTELANSVKQELLKELNIDTIDTVKLDITNKDSIRNAVTYLNFKYKKIDALVNNAYPRNKNFGDSFFNVEFDNFNDNVSSNLGGYFLSSQQFGLYFKEQGYGNIINISSIYGVIAPKFELYKNTNMVGVPVEYAVIKSALIHLTKYMAKYFKGSNIRVNAISPGGIFDNQPDEFLQKYNSNSISKGMLDSEDLTGTLTYLLSDMSKYVNGQNIIVDDGFVL